MSRNEINGRALAEQLGVEVWEGDGLLVLDAPTGFIFNSTLEHCSSFGTDDAAPSVIWKDILIDLKQGLSEGCSAVNDEPCEFCN